MPVGDSMREFVAKHAVLSVDGTIMAAAKNVIFRWGLNVHVEYVDGTDIPRVIHGGFHGEVQCESIYVSDDNWAAIATQRDRNITIINADQDTQTVPGQRVESAIVKVQEFERQGPPNADGVIRAAMKAVMTTDPVMS
jgi:hypothetical protein